MSAVITGRVPAIHRVAVVDDDTEQAEVMSLWLEEADFQPILIQTVNPFERPQQVVDLIRNQADGAVCDHRLTPHRFSTFNGAELSAALYDSRIPTILTTQYDMDVDVSIRKWRHKIPVLLSRDATDSESIRQGLFASAHEISGQMSEARKPHRSLIRVADMGVESEATVLDVIIPSWNPLRAVRFPLSLIPVGIQASVASGTRLFALVNIGADDSQDLYFDSFELAPEPDPNNGLA